MSETSKHLKEMVAEAEAEGFYEISNSEYVAEWIKNNSTRLPKQKDNNEE
jgi:hypothetical protein